MKTAKTPESITYKTDAEGNVTFAGVSPGEYVIAYHLPGQWRATKNADASKTNYPVSSVPQSRASSGRSEPFTLTMGQSGVRMYIGAMLSRLGVRHGHTMTTTPTPASVRKKATVWM